MFSPDCKACSSWSSNSAPATAAVTPQRARAWEPRDRLLVVARRLQRNIWAGICSRVKGWKIDSWNRLGNKFEIEVPMSHVHVKINFLFGIDSWNRCLSVHKRLQIRALESPETARGPECVSDFNISLSSSPEEREPVEVCSRTDNSPTCGSCSQGCNSPISSWFGSADFRRMRREGGRLRDLSQWVELCTKSPNKL